MASPWPAYLCSKPGCRFVFHAGASGTSPLHSHGADPGLQLLRQLLSITRALICNASPVLGLRQGCLQAVHFHR